MSLILSGTDGLSDVDGTAATPAIRGTDANTGIFFPAADTIAFAEGGVEAMRIDSSANVGIGTSSPVARLHVLDSLSGGQLIVSSSQTDSSNKYGTFATQHYTNAEEPALCIAMECASSANNVLIGGALGEFNAATNIQFYTASNNTTTGGTERARIDSSGNLLVGTTSLSTSERLNVTYAPANTGIVLNTSSTPVANSILIDFLANGTRGGVIVFTNLGVTTAYVTSSDYRLKENIQPMTGALAKVAQLKPVTYKWKNNGTNSDGFIAHELAEVCPQAVNGEKDAVNEDGSINPQGIDTSFLVATLTAAIQEQQALITTLAARITALESA